MDFISHTTEQGYETAGRLDSESVKKGRIHCGLKSSACSIWLSVCCCGQSDRISRVHQGCIQIVSIQERVRTLLGTPFQRERDEIRELRESALQLSVDPRETGGKMSLCNSVTASGQDYVDSGNRAHGGDARTVLKPSTPTRKPPKPQNAITIGVSARVLFNMEKEQQIYEQQGMEEYIKYQVEHETQPFSPGPAFSFVKALEAVNTRLRELYPESEELFDVVLMTNNHAYVGLRLINTINHHQLFIERFCMTGGNSPIGYLKAYHTNLYLSADPVKVREALEEGIAAATMFTPEKMSEVSETQLRVAFDGDAVLFSDESERIYKAHGLDKFFEHEKEHENKLLDHGPLKGFLEALGKLQKKFYGKGQRMDCPIRTYLVTARSAASSGTRALKTLRSWGLEIDEALFLAGAPKGPMLEKIRPHIFFDDQLFHVEGAAEMGTVACHVPYGIAQRAIKRETNGKETSSAPE